MRNLVHKKPFTYSDLEHLVMDVFPGSKNVREQCIRALSEVGSSQEFCEFFSDVLQYEYEMNHSIYRLGQNLQEQRIGDDPLEPGILFKTTQDLTRNFNQWKQKVTELAERGKDIPALNINPKVIAKSKVLRALCSVQTKDVNVQKGDELTVTDTSQPNRLKVRTSRGEEGYIPALTCILPTPDRSALTASERLQIQLLAAWTECVRKIRKILMDTLLMYTHKLSDDWRDHTNNNIATLAKDRVSRRFRRIIDAANKADPRSDLARLHNTLYSVERELTSWNENGAELNGMIDTVANLDKAVLCYQMYHQQWQLYRKGLISSARPIHVVDNWKQLRSISEGKSFKYYEMRVTLESEEVTEEVTYITSSESGSGGSGSSRQSISADQVTSTSMETKQRIVISSVVDPRTGEEISFQQSLDDGIINQNIGMYVNPVTKEMIPIPIAMNEGKIKVEYVTTKKTAEKTTAVGLISIKSKQEDIGYTILGAIDPNTGEKIDADEARHRDLLNEGEGYFVISTSGEKISLSDAIDSGWVQVRYDTKDGKPVYETKTYAVNSVVDQKRKTKVPFHEAVQLGLIDRDTGNYINNVTREKVYVLEAINRGFLKAKVVDDPSTLNIDSENKMTIDRIGMLKKSIMKPIEAITAFRQAAARKQAS